jgi:hypothetical protein
MAGPFARWSKVKVSSVIQFLNMKNIKPMKFTASYWRCKASVMSWKQVWISCHAFDNGRTDAHFNQRLHHPSALTINDNMCHADAHIRDYRCVMTDVGGACGMHGGEEKCIQHFGG